MSLSEIQSCLLNTPERTIIRAVNRLIKSGKLEHKRIHGKGKRKRYAIEEEETKNDITIRTFPEKAWKGKNLSVDEMLAIQTRPKITQRDFSKYITESKKHYNEQLLEMKQFEETLEYYTYHIAMISNCLEWVTKLTLALNSGMLGDSPNKLNLAQRNKERYEEWLQLLCKNIKVYDKKLGGQIIRELYHELTNLWFMEKYLNAIP